MENKAINISKFILGLVLIAIIMDIPHLLFGFDVLSIFSIFFFLCIGAAVFSWNLRIYKFLLLFICLLVPIESLSYFWGNIELGITLWNILLTTNYKEVIEQLLRKELIWVLLSLIILGIGVIAINRNLLAAKLSVLQRSVFGCVGIVGVVICSIVLANAKYRGSVNLGFKNLHPLQYVSSLAYCQKRRMRVSSFEKERNAYSFGMVQLERAILDTNIVVLVIGETIRYDHLSLNGYYRKTTPYLDNQTNLYSFDDVSAPAGGTIYSIPLVMTGCAPYQYEEHYRYKGIIDAFREGHYYTAYLTNQEEQKDDSFKDEYHYQSVDTFVNTSLGNTNRNFLQAYYDTDVIKPLSGIIGNYKHKNLFVVIHLMGAHWAYDKRYPPEYDVFKAGDNPRYKNKYGYDHAIAQYDNAILYEDYVFEQIIQLLKKRNGNASLLYLSDHGENLKDDERQLVDHSPQPNKYLLHIPYFIWLNNQMNDKLPNIELLKKHKKVPLLSSEATLFTLMDLAGLQTTALQRDQQRSSILSPYLDESEQPVFAPFFQKLRYPDLLKN